VLDVDAWTLSALLFGTEYDLGVRLQNEDGRGAESRSQMIQSPRRRTPPRNLHCLRWAENAVLWILMPSPIH
jgi:hypothetical protein